MSYNKCLFCTVKFEDLQDMVNTWHQSNKIVMNISIGYTAGMPNGTITCWVVQR